LPTHFTKPTGNCLPAGLDPGIPDTAIFGKRAFPSQRPYPNPFFVSLKQQAIAGADSQGMTNLAWNGNLALTCYLCLFLQFISSSLLYHRSPYFCRSLKGWDRPRKVEVKAEILLRIAHEFDKSMEWLLTGEDRP